LCEPLRAAKTVEIDAPPVGAKRVADISFEVGIFPLRTGHDVVVVPASHICLDAPRALDLGVVVRVVGDIARVKNPKWTAMTSVEIFYPRPSVGGGELHYGATTS
jgi:hypothetical protein